MAVTTFTVTGTFTKPDGTARSGKVVFRQKDRWAVNNSTVQDQVDLVVTLDGAGKINGSSGQTLVQCTNGYYVLIQLDPPANGFIASGMVLSIPGGAGPYDLSSYTPS